jgi:WD40 repeat protein
VRVWDLATGAQRGEPLTGHNGWVLAVAFGELDGRGFALSGDADGTVQIFDLVGNRGSTLVVSSDVTAVAFAPPVSGTHRRKRRRDADRVRRGVRLNT